MPMGWQIVIIAVVILVLFGAPKLPKLARSVGQSMRIFKSEVKTMREEDGKNTDASEHTQRSEDEEPRPVEGRIIRHDPRPDASPHPAQQAHADHRDDRG